MGNGFGNCPMWDLVGRSTTLYLQYFSILGFLSCVWNTLKNVSELKGGAHKFNKQ